MTCRFTLGVALLLGSTAAADEPFTLKDFKGWVGAVAFGPDSKSLVVGTSDGSVAVWDMVSREKMFSHKVHDDAVAALAFSRDGEFLASAAHDGALALEPFGRDGGRKGIKYGGDNIAILALTFAADGLLFFGGSDATVRIWDKKTRVHTGANIRDHTSWVNSIALSRDGSMLASASSDKTLRLRRTADLKSLHTFRVKEGEVRSVAFSPNGNLVAAGIRYGGVRVWEIESKKEVASLKAHDGETWAVAFTPDGKTLASGGGDWNKPGEVRLWDTGTWKERATLKHTGEVLCLSISANGRYFAAGSWDRTVRIWKLNRD